MPKPKCTKAKIAPGLVALILGSPGAVTGALAEEFSCPEFPKPSVVLEFGSRYKDESKSRSEKDKNSDEEVTKALKPSDDFVQDVTKISNRALEDPELRDVVTECVIGAVHDWAEADAFSDMRTMNARISYPARVAGIAVAYKQVRPFAEDYAEEREEIESWLGRRADEIVEFWNNDAPPLASQANLRAWAALATTQIGLILDEPSYLDWSLLSMRIILDTQDEDGSLPLEMRRGKWGLHYQLHAMAPMTVSTALLCQAGYRNPEAYEERLDEAVAFSLKAIGDPGIAEEITGKEQTVEAGLDNQKTFAIAWLEAYQNFNFDPEFDKELQDFRPMNNSKLGGDLTLLYRNNSDRPLGCRDQDNS
jgi:poly(beta-D-mannuronate) lyase